MEVELRNAKLRDAERVFNDRNVTNALELIELLSDEKTTIGELKKDLQSITPFEQPKNMPLYIAAQTALKIIEDGTNYLQFAQLSKPRN